MFNYEKVIMIFSNHFQNFLYISEISIDLRMQVILSKENMNLNYLTLQYKTNCLSFKGYNNNGI